MVFGDVGHHSRLAGRHHFAGDALAQMVAPAFALAGRETVSRFDIDFAGFAIEQGDGAAQHAHVLGHGRQQRPYDVAQVQAAIQGLADLEEQGKFLHLAAYGGDMGTLSTSIILHNYR
ncbi:hypothetical protein DFAR_2290001 [Desulfarculales bacterium]